MLGRSVEGILSCLYTRLISPSIQGSREEFTVCTGVVEPVDPWDGRKKSISLPDPLPSSHIHGAPSTGLCQ